jgi:hypothetical protein
MKFLNYLNELSKQEAEKRAKYKGKPVSDIPKEDLWMDMQSGNTKLDKSIKIFNLPAGKSCPNAKDCYKTCYARKAERRFPEINKKGEIAKGGPAVSRARNFRMAKEVPDLLKAQILKHLKKGDLVRIHESGEFFSQEYLDMWTEIVKARPDVTFYTYTKTEQMWNWSKIKALPNFNLVSSLINGKKNYGPEEEITITAKSLGIPICPCRKNNKVKCGIDCTICSTPGNSAVLFVQH